MLNSYAHLCTPVSGLIRAALGCTYLCEVMCIFCLFSIRYSTYSYIVLYLPMFSYKTVSGQQIEKTTYFGEGLEDIWGYFWEGVGGVLNGFLSVI